MVFFKRKKPPKEGNIIIKLCPVCGSEKIKPLNALTGWISQLQYICENCGYCGTIILEVEGDKESLKSMLDENKS
ncbi:MAG: hypothetical protein ACTSYR_01300 [Candidatus Odinarchaeia archaeon]